MRQSQSWKIIPSIYGENGNKWIVTARWDGSAPTAFSTFLHIPHELQIPRRGEHLIGIARVTCLLLGQGTWRHLD